MQINPKIFKNYDIRALYPEEINEAMFPDVISAIYTLFVRKLSKKNLSVGLSHDMRISSPALFEVAKNTLISLGATVYELGLASTPTCYFSLLNLKLDAAIQISASHNPKEWNGVKFAYRSGDTIKKISALSGMNEVREYALTRDFEPLAEGGSSKKVDSLLEREFEFALGFLPSKNIKPFTIAVDPANAMGILMLDMLEKKLPLTLIKMNYTLDGTFPAHEANPLKFELLKDLQKLVVDKKAQLGIAPDGDGDRVFFIDENGTIVPSKIIASLIAKELLVKNKGGKIVVDICNTRNIKNACKTYGGEMVISPVGHSIITDVINREGALFCGESSGHYYYRESGGAENTIRTILILLEMMTQTGKPLSQLASENTTAYESGEFNFKFPSSVATAPILKEIAQKYGATGELSTLDGIAVDFENWRFNIRTSNTEPLMRLNVEGDTNELVQAKLKEMSDVILTFGAEKK